MKVQDPHLLAIEGKVLFAIRFFNGTNMGLHKVNTQVYDFPQLQNRARLIVVTNAKLIRGFWGWETVQRARVHSYVNKHRRAVSIHAY